MLDIEHIEIMEDLDHDYETPIQNEKIRRDILWRRFRIGLVIAAVDLIGIAYIFAR
ncbi:MAG: hypothetical protein KAI86_12010 [Desulfobacterales bacterium]|nr:hypothetical protein [Desulfobacterales bacterium]